MHVAKGGIEPLVLKNSAFGQLTASWRNAAPLTGLFANNDCQMRIHETAVPNKGSDFPAGAFFNKINPRLKS